MKRLLLVALLCSAPSSFAQVHVQIELPTIRFAAPPPVFLAEPGIQVVEGSDDEVFFVDNFYWHRRGDHWFRTARHDGNWAAVEVGVVPRPLIGLPVGKYRHWKHEVREERREDRREDRHEKHEEKREEHKEKKGKH